MPSNTRSTEAISFWTGGLNSWLHPSSIAKNQYAWGENVINRGGLVQTRPGYKFRGSKLGSNAQGGCIFTPLNSTARIVIAVDGKIYAARWPALEFVEVPGLTFNPDVKQIVFETAIQSVENRPDGTIRALGTPKPVLMIQDGVTRCGYWDGVESGHLDPGENQTPIGLWMVWAYSRLWIASGSKVIACDIANPLSNTENTYIAERSNFELPGECTGLIKAHDSIGIIATTKTSTTAFKGYILDRTDWQVTEDFQKEIAPGVGCVAGKSMVNQYGKTYWFSDRGMISLDSAIFSQQSSKLVTLDSAMNRSKRNLSPDLSGICAGTFGDFLLMSVPSGSRWNAHTWVADQAPMEDQSNESAFCSVWTGIRPVQWFSGRVGAKQRLFCLSYDATQRDDTNIHLWEAFHESREDADHAISCQFETMMLTSASDIAFKFAEIEAIEILGGVDVRFYVGGIGGPWIPIGSTHVEAEKGSLGSTYQTILSKETILEAFKPQSRSLKTTEFVNQGFDCHPEIKTHGKSKGFQILVEWDGQFGIREIRIHFDTLAPQVNKGGCIEDETLPNAVNEQGESRNDE